MKEREYIAVATLARVRCASSALRDCIPDSASEISVQEYQEILCKLESWQERLRAKIKVK